MALRKRGIQVFRIQEGRNNQKENNIIVYNARTKPEQNLNWAIGTLEEMIGIPARDVIDVQLYGPNILEQYKIETIKNSLGEKSPDVAKEWNYLRNGDILPTMFANSSNRKVWWVCSECGYEWQATIVNRSAGHGCPKCAIAANAKQRATANPGLSFADKHPDLLEEWNYSKNDGKSPYLANGNSHEKVWWTCSKCGYEWQASLAKRSFGRGCPVCNHRIVIPGKNDFLVEYPQLDKEWDYSKNTGIDPHKLSAKSHVKVHWRCVKCGNEWLAEIATRTGGSGCPKCGKKSTAKKLSSPPEGQSLGDLFPELVAEWDYIKNDPLAAYQVYPKSTKKAWWKWQKCGHEWQAVIASRAKGTKCPLCSGHDEMPAILS